MRNLFAFLIRNYYYILFFALQALSFYFIIRNNNYQYVKFINSSNAMAGELMAARENVTQYFKLKEENEKLAQENARLLNQLRSSYSAYSKDSIAINDTVYRQKYIYYPARVVNNTIDRRINYLTLDKGSKQGIRVDMGVISGSGIVGTVVAVSENFCTVMSVLHEKSKVSCKIKKDGTFGPLSWDGADYRYATLSDIPHHARLAKNDTILTSNVSVTFPEGIIVGNIDKFEIKSGETFFTIRVKLSTDFKKLNHVYIVSNIMKEEQQHLEETTQDDK